MNVERLQKAFETASRELLARRTPDGHWIGRLSASALSTATAVSALSIYRKTRPDDEKLDHLIRQGVDWILSQQNADGGWGDTDKSFSNISTTLLVRSALLLSESPVPENAVEYIERQGGLDAVTRRYGKDKTFSVPIMTNAALAGLVPWKDVPQLPFERAALPQSLFRLLKLQVVSYAIPALVAIGQVRFHHHRNFRPIRNFLRQCSVKPTLRLIERMQPESGGYLEAAPLTAFVVMSLVACGHAEHPVVRGGVRFLVDTVRDDGSWPIDTNLATWATTLSINALGAETLLNEPRTSVRGLIDWLLSCQHRKKHPFTGADPGGWGWTDLSGAVPDADDTAGALRALEELWDSACYEDHPTITKAANEGLLWLASLQNADGGMPTFCRGWGLLPFDQSSTDLTAHAFRAFTDWCGYHDLPYEVSSPVEKKMLRYLYETQNSDGSWHPLWFGNQHQPNDVNPFYGTARVVSALVGPRVSFRTYDEKKHVEMVRRGAEWIFRNQNADGGWGGDGIVSSVEETAVTVEALAVLSKYFSDFTDLASVYQRGLNWLVESVESGRFTEASPIGLYFAKLWYYEDLYPIIFTTAALRAALEKQ